MTSKIDAVDGIEDNVEISQFRATFRAWAEAHVPRDWEYRFGPNADKEYIEVQRSWLAQLRDAGYAAPHWSKEWGGGFSIAEQVVIFEELSRLNAPRLRSYYVGLNHAYATLTEFGTDAQRQRHLPAILEGEMWCQGFSEPEAGSDLAALRTRAVRDGDTYVVNGQKIWSSEAMHADWCLLLARTGPQSPKRRGISFFLLDMHAPGVEVRPIKQATGAAEFCELFLTDVVIPTDQLVGTENDGWRVAQSTLASERGQMIQELAERLARAIGWLVDLARKTDIVPGRAAITDPGIREGIVELETRVEILRRLCRKLVEDMIHRGGPSPEASIVKVVYSELLRDIMDFGVSFAGLNAHRFSVKAISAGYESGNWMLDYIDSWSWITGGGTNDIQRTLIGERVLGLPKEPQV